VFDKKIKTARMEILVKLVARNFMEGCGFLVMSIKF
jgi:hypothetical protein